MDITILVTPRVQMLDVVGPMEVFHEANRQLGNPEAYKVRILSTMPGLVIGTGGVRMLPDGDITERDRSIDTLLVCGDAEPAEPDPLVTSWLARRVPGIPRYGAICTGAFLMAAAGLLDGHRATTHWQHAAKLAADYPAVVVDADSIFVRDGMLFTAAGSTAGIDLALSLVEDDFGRDLALSIARSMVMVVKRPGTQVQVSPQLAAQASARDVIQEVCEYVLGNLNADLSVQALADRACMSTRNFSRVFRRETNFTPGEFVEMARLQAARCMLEDKTPPAMKMVAYRCGFETVNNMRRAFLRALGVCPSDYRRRFEQAGQPASLRPLSGPGRHQDGRHTARVEVAQEPIDLCELA